MIRVLLVDDHTAFRQALGFVIDREQDIRVVKQAGSVVEASLLGGQVDVAVVDIDLPDGSGIELINELRKAQPGTKILVLTGSASRKDVALAVEAGAAGVLHKSVEVEQIIDAVRRLHAGEFLIDPREVIEMLRVVRQVREQERDAQAALARITPRERDVLQALAEGLTDKQIAQRLGISVETVRTHIVNLLGKLGVDSRLKALVFAARYGAVKLG
ncbi:MAG TPA: response regulator transcription factor [Herpetosiphonaceae bacterium]